MADFYLQKEIIMKHSIIIALILLSFQVRSQDQIRDFPGFYDTYYCNVRLYEKRPYSFSDSNYFQNRHTSVSQKNENEEIIEAIKNPKRVEILSLNAKSLVDAEIEIDFTIFTRLKSLSIFNAHLCTEEVQKWLNQLKNIEIYSLSISSGTFDFSNLDNLKVLYIDDEYSNSSEISASIGRLKNLEYINIVSSTTNIPLTLFQLENLKCISLNMPNLIQIPYEWRNFKELKNLRIYSEELDTIPLSIFEVDSLFELSLYCPKVSSFPKVTHQTKLYSLEVYCKDTKGLSTLVCNSPNLEVFVLYSKNLDLSWCCFEDKEFYTLYILSDSVSWADKKAFRKLKRKLKKTITHNGATSYLLKKYKLCTLK